MLDKFQAFLQNKRNLIILLAGLLLVLALRLLMIPGDKELPKPEQPTIIKTETTLSTQPKNTPNDPDVIIDQHYTAQVNGERVTVPVETTGNNGTTGVIQQEINLTPLVDKAAQLGYQKGKQEFKKNWEIGTGVGVHNSETYIPIELQRNYATDKAIAAEVHLDFPEVTKITGWEVKHKWKF